MKAALLNGVLVAALMVATAVGQAADLRVRVDAREVTRKRVHTDLTLAVREGPLTLVFPKWIPGEHGPTGPLGSIIGLVIRANGAPLAWRRDPRDMYAISLTVPRAAAHLDIALDTGLATEGGNFSAGPTSSAALAVLPWNELVLLPKGRDAGGLSTEAAVFAPPGWQLSCALELRPQAGLLARRAARELLNLEENYARHYRNSHARRMQALARFEKEGEGVRIAPAEERCVPAAATR